MAIQVGPEDARLFLICFFNTEDPGNAVVKRDESEAGGAEDEKKRRTYYRKALELINKDAVVLMLGICLSTKRTAGVLRILRPIAGVTPAGPMAGRRIPGLKMARIPSRPAVEILEHSPFNSTRSPLTLPQRKRAVGPSLSRERERVRRFGEV